ncbi:cupin domain-containing protein [Pseudoflavonifractor capillosus]|uniref:Cupin domain-containing protein n=1 Tax=Pseudoflavonifractor capillosus TaxID=106588 RepID=A0A921MNB8_9FIRM|nr:cupin domain-containing protein [Pseudoflavonifractor capillosus]HJG87377.1 cupin domain-containing protein [Pseudoflavonifractor capillosus]
MDKQALEALVRQVLLEKLGETPAETVKKVPVPQLKVTEEHRMDTGRAGDRVYTRDLFTLSESPRLGAGIMEMTDTTFPWTLNYDEMDYVIEGRLDIQTGRGTVSAGPGEIIYIPRGSAVRFSVTGHARFLYFVYPADWQGRNA